MLPIKFRTPRTFGLSDEFNSLQRDVNRLFGDFLRGWNEEPRAINVSWNPAVDIAETPSEYIVKAEIPGVPKESVTITLESNVLTLRGEKKSEAEEKGKDFHRVERFFGTFERSFTLPSNVKSDKIEASYKDGILTVTIPKTEEAKPKQIEVKVK